MASDLTRARSYAAYTSSRKSHKGCATRDCCNAQRCSEYFTPASLQSRYELRRAEPGVFVALSGR